MTFPHAYLDFKPIGFAPDRQNILDYLITYRGKYEFFKRPTGFRAETENIIKKNKFVRKSGPGN